MLMPYPLLPVVEKIIEAVLKLDEETRNRLQALDGRSIRFHIKGPEWSVIAYINDGQVQLGQATDDQGQIIEGLGADTTISGTISALRSLMSGNDALYRGEVSIEGDMATGQALKEILAHLHPDWQDALSPFIGDSAVHRLDRTSSGLYRWLKRTRESFARNTSDYLQEEIELLAPNAQVQAFCTEVDAIRAEYDRLDARLRLLEQQAVSCSSEQAKQDD